jgi:hypothetical protein
MKKFPLLKIKLMRISLKAGIIMPIGNYAEKRHLNL